MKYTSCRQDRTFRDSLINRLNLDQKYGWVLEWIVDEFAPEDVFEEPILEDWAEEHGFVKEK